MVGGGERILAPGGAVQKIIEAAQVWERHGDLWRGGQLHRPGRRATRLRFTRGEGARLLDDGVGADQLLAVAVFHCPTHAVERMIDQELQDLYESSRAGSRPVVFFELGAVRGEAGWKLPVAVNRSMVQCARFVAESGEVMERVKNRRAGYQGPLVGCNNLAADHNRDSVDIGLDRHGLERKRPRNAVPITIESHSLIFVDQSRGADHARIEPIAGKRGRGGPFLSEPRSDQEWTRE